MTYNRKEAELEVQACDRLIIEYRQRELDANRELVAESKEWLLEHNEQLQQWGFTPNLLELEHFGG